MKRLTTTVMGLAALVAMLVLGVFSAGAAQAHTFLWTGGLPGLLLALADGPQSFTAVAGGAAVICKHAHFHGKFATESALTQVVVGEYFECEVEGTKATVSTAEYELSADETVSVINKDISINVPGVCTITVKPQNNLKGIRYLVDPNSANQRILAHVEAEKITSTIGGGLAFICGGAGEHKEEGSYRGLLLAWVDGTGTLKWS